MIKVILAEDHHMVRAGIHALLDRAHDIDVVGEAENGMQVIQLVQQLTPDVVVMDINMPHLNGLDATKQIKESFSSTKVVILSMYSDRTLIRRALESGAKGYLLKHSVTEELLLAVRAAAIGKSYICTEVADQVLVDYQGFLNMSDDQLPIDLLTSRERQVLQLIAEGHTNREAALVMNISERTVEKHRAHMMEKLEVQDLAGLIKVALKNGLISLDE